MALDFLPGNRLELLENGAEFFPALLQAIDEAREEVQLETYIFECDEIGEAVLAALVRAVARGVRTRLLVDGFGSRDFVLQRMHGVAAAGVEVEVYRPLRGPWFIPRRHRLRRLHRKLVCCDGRVAFVGGINILSDFTRPFLNEGARNAGVPTTPQPCVRKWVEVHRHSHHEDAGCPALRARCL